ncbi:GIY-YIG nuclease family protein [Paenibacillus campi]|uniref:GIY-YIG nuclease family protein n=1 Tax=Paenibacillus campi TaxID=3106031 RepID=UPI002AFDDE0F|nr:MULTISPECIES: GIY-YIG nuclease family protein [unclassified Paenibacillus]
MNRRKELQQQYKETPIEAGVYAVRNVAEHKVWVDSLPNLRSLNGRTFSLELGSFVHRELQADWSRLGQEQFVIDVLEIVKPPENAFDSHKDLLADKQQQWTERLRAEGWELYHPLEKNTSL